MANNIASSSSSVPGKVDVAAVWDNLRDGLDTAYRRENMPSSKYMELYTSVYNYCTSITLSGGITRRPPPGVLAAAAAAAAAAAPPAEPVEGEEAAAGADAKNPTARLTHIGADFVGHEMYKRVKDYVADYVTEVLRKGTDLNSVGLLQYYTDEWNNFRISSKVMDGIFSYLNRHWIRRELDEGHDDIYMIYTLALAVWKECLFVPLKDKIIDAVLDLIARERNGEVINNSLVSGVVECLVELGIDEYEPSDGSAVSRREGDKLSVYRQCFEHKFLEASREFYSKEADRFLETNGTISDYMILVEKRLEEEEKRCHLYLNESTKKSLASCCEEVLISKKIEFFQSQFPSLLFTNRDDDLGRMFKLCERVQNGLEQLRNELERHITKEGHEALEKVALEASTDSKLYVKTLLDVHTRYQNLVSGAFKGDPGFTQALDKAATSFINKNAVTARAPGPQSSSKSAELLAKYCDQLLKKSSRMPDERELEDTLNMIIVVFKYIEDKDVFSKFYTRMFSKRLINDASSNDESEANFISKLKHMCGYEYTAKLSKMINDTQVSKDLCTEFKEKMTPAKKAKLGLEFNILIVSSGSWPTFPNISLNIPAKLTESIEQFTDFYNAKFNGRRLTWIYAQSRGEVVSQCYPKKYVFTTTTAQMTAMLLFNEQDSYSMGKICEATGMDSKNATVVIASLLKNDVLKCDKETTQDEIPSDATISLNLAYSNKKVKVDLSKMSIRHEVTKDTDVVQRGVEDDRKGVISACIVRIMKTRKRISHQQLMTEVIQQLASRFKPKVDLIKRCVGSLIEKEYMMRIPNQKDLYEYIA